jgi:hypothetical protein
MPLHIPWLRGARRLLLEKIDQLHRTLVTLTDRVRQAIAEAVGKAVSGVVQETVRAVLDQLHGPLPLHRQLEYEPRSSRRLDDPGGLFPGGVPPDDLAEEEERPYNSFADERFPASPYRETAFDEESESPSPADVPARPPSRWRAWLALCLQAVAWWLRRGLAVPLLATAGIALAGGALTCLGGTHLLASTVGAAGTASDLVGMIHNTSVGAGTLAGVLAP